MKTILAILLLVCAVPAQLSRFDTFLQSGDWSVITHNGRPALAHIQFGEGTPITQVGPAAMLPGTLSVAFDHQMTFVHDSRACAVGKPVSWAVTCDSRHLGYIPASGTFTTTRPFTIETGGGFCSPHAIYAWRLGYNNESNLPCDWSGRPPDIVVSVFDVRFR